ncbi:hypothetical protein SARC_15432 [Sphaeroforma arctica JP610]|uniref:NUDE domain-containing protein n=1 Tax=Sphaeroforma arctica JP610 TaxID=667725 RepID=A0A0L0F5V2_9EUKA|nr:hypothetical protein SARC_15432 [Sphaeroforma arctica JP610]KNC72019.1 hypothetical protein SARC_15432 [Sphaeroforma arctica JP610]|eukprot:XP_014145921.1 hypothetical protein SARC_15432 [Sphaeroforma arctica JP610]
MLVCIVCSLIVSHTCYFSQIVPLTCISFLMCIVCCLLLFYYCLKCLVCCFQSDEIEQTARRAQADIEGLNDQTEDTLEQIAYVEQENAMLVIELQHVKEQMKELQIELEVFNIRHKRKEMEQAEQLEIARAHNSMLKGSATPTLSPSLTPTPTPTSMETHTDMQGYTHTPHYTHTHTGPGSANSITGGVDAMVIDSKQPTQDNHVHTTSHTHTHAHAHTHTAAGNHIQDSSAQVNGTGGHVSEVNRTSHSDSGSRKDSVTNERHQSIRATRGSNPRTGQQSSSGSGGSSSSSSSSSSRTSKKRVSSSGGGERHYTTGDTEASDSDKGPSKLQSLADRVGKCLRRQALH